MPLWSLGSVTTHVGAVVGWSNLPTGVSGTVFTNMADLEIAFVEQFIQGTIDNTNITEKYQPAIVDLLHSKILVAIDSSEGADNVSIGDLSVSQSEGGNASLAKQLREGAIQRLKELQRTVRFKRVLGG